MEFELSYYGKIVDNPDRPFIEIQTKYDMLVEVKNKEKEEMEEKTKTKK